MTWPKISDDFSDDCWELSDAAWRLHAEGLIWNSRKLLDLRLDKDEMRRWAKRPEAADELVTAGFWLDRGDHYEIAHHGGYQPTREQALRKQSASQENGRKGGRPRGSGRREITARKTQSKTQSLTQTETQPGFRPGFRETPSRDGKPSTKPSQGAQSLTQDETQNETQRERRSFSLLGPEENDGAAHRQTVASGRGCGGGSAYVPADVFEGIRSGTVTYLRRHGGEATDAQLRGRLRSGDSGQRQHWAVVRDALLASGVLIEVGGSPPAYRLADVDPFGAVDEA